MFGLFKKKTPVEATPPLFFSILLSQNLVQAALWTIDNGVIHIKGKSSIRPYFDEADCLVKLDECLQELGTEGEAVSQTIFHLDHSFTDERGIFAEKKDFFKNLLSSLQLTSIGFVANVEAVVGSKIEEDENLAHQLVIEFAKNNTLFSLYEGKLLLGNYLAENNVDLAGQLEAALEKFKEGGVDLTTLEVLNATLISSLLTTEELATKESSFPEQLPLKLTYIGSDIILPVVAAPGATAIAKSKGWLTPSVATTGESVSANSRLNSSVDVPTNNTAAPMTAGTPAMVADATTPGVSTAAADAMSDDMNDLSPPAAKKPKKPFPTKALVIAGVIIGVLVVFVVIFFMVVGRATANVVLEPRSVLLSRAVEVTIDPTADESNFEELILAGELSTAEITQRVTVTATGTQEIGEYASGVVTLINRRTSEQSLSSGTTLTAVNGGLTFTLTESVTVAAGTRGDNDVITPATHDVEVQATVIGPDSNIAADARLRVGAHDIDLFEAVTRDGLSGGASDEVTVVAAADVTRATTEVTAALTEAASELGTREGSRFFTPIASDLTITSSETSVNVGEEANEFILTATATVPLVAYDISDLRLLATAVLEEELPDGFVMVGEPELMSAVDEGAASGNALVLQADLTSRAVAEIDLDDLSSALLGQPLLRVDNILRENDAIRAFEIQWSSDLYPSIFRRLPNSADRLEFSFYNTDQ